MKYIVTGGAGFIGSHLVDALLKADHDVLVLDDFSTGKDANLAQHKNNTRLTVHKKSVCDDLNGLFAKNKDTAAVFHLAALARVQFSIRNPIETHHANVEGTLNLLNLCRVHGIKRFVFSSSSSIFGDQKTLPLMETMTPNPMSPYALHKLVGEHYCRMFQFLYGLEAVSLRYFNVYGPRQNPDGDYATLVPRFITMIHKGVAPTINGDGEQTRDFTYVGDVVASNLLAAQTKNAKCFGETFNIGAGQNQSVNEVTRQIMTLSQKKIEPLHGPAVVEPKHTRADISKAKDYLGWQPKTPFDLGLKQTFDYCTR